MKREELRRCPVCTEPVPPGEVHCPNGHRCVWEFGSDAFDSTPTDTGFLESELAQFGNTDAGIGGSRLAGETPPLADHSANFLFECASCSRLVETQHHDGRSVEPSFCPWCGAKVESVLGRELDGYRLDRLLSSGGFGVVYLASNSTQPSMKSVVKILLPKVAYSRPDFVDYFVEEARITEEIGQTCWNIVRVSNVREKPWPYFFMEYIRGPTLEHLIAGRPASIPIDECLGFLRGMARALVATHAKKRAHQDLKPLNIMVIPSSEVPVPEDRIKMLDFGLSTRVGRPESLDFTDGSGVIATTDVINGQDSPVANAGTPEYMAPERFDGTTDYRADLYAFGVTAFEILSGSRPWRDPGKSDQRVQHWRKCHSEVEPKQLGKLRPDVPSWLVRVVSDCLKKSPDDRVQSAEELLGRLEAPLPMRTKLSLAGVVVLVLSLIAFSVFKADYKNTLTTWSAEGPANVHGPTVYVRDSESAFALKTKASAADDCTWVARVGDLTLDASQVRFKTQADSVSVRIDASFFAKQIRDETQTTLDLHLSGVGKGVQHEAALSIQLDTSPPKFVGPIRYRVDTIDSESEYTGNFTSGDLHLRTRNTELVLELSVREEHLSHAYIEGFEDEPFRTVSTDQGERKSLELTFSDLFELDPEEGRFERQLQIVDLAGNRTSRQLSFVVDNSVDVDGLDSSRPILTKNAALVAFTLREKLATIELADSKSVDNIDSRIASCIDAEHVVGKALPLIQTAIERHSRPASNLVAGSYFLVLEMKQKSQEYKVRLIDASAHQPNLLERTLALSNTAEPPSVSTDLQKAEIEIGAESWTLDLTRASDPAPPIRHLKLDPEDAADQFTARLIARCAQGRFLEARLLEKRRSADGTAIRAKTPLKEGTLPGSFEIPTLVLVHEEERLIDLSFLGPIGAQLNARFRVRADARPPRLKVAHNSPTRTPNSDGPTGVVSEPAEYSTDKADGIRLSVTADENLAAVELYRGEEHVDTLVAKDGKSFSGSLSKAGIRGEGTHIFSIHASDMAGHEATSIESIVLNPAGPRISSDDLKKDPAALGRKTRVRLDVIDLNGIDLASIRVHAIWNGESPTQKRDLPFEITTLKALADGAPEQVQVLVDLWSLPDRCTGTVEVSAKDRSGRASNPFSVGFDFARAGYRPSVEWPMDSGLHWDLIQERFYVTRTEISNEHYRKLTSASKQKFPSPRFWTIEEGEVRAPRYELQDGTRIAGGNFPLVGLDPKEAEAFAARTLGARLPTFPEWVAAGRLGDIDGDYPWRAPERKPKSLMNCQNSAERILSLRAKTIFWAGKSSRCHHMPVHSSLFDEQAPTERFPQVLHQLGNVAELVRLDSGDYGRAGGHYGSPVATIGLQKKPVERFGSDYGHLTTGLRLVFPLVDEQTLGGAATPGDPTKQAGIRLAFKKHAKLKD